MKADAKPTFDDVAKLLAKGGDVPDWVIDRLDAMAPLIRGDKGEDDDALLSQLTFTADI
jgi:hypothetical protein